MDNYHFINRKIIGLNEEIRDGTMEKENLCYFHIKMFLEKRAFITNPNVRLLCNVSVAMENRIFAELVTD